MATSSPFHWNHFTWFISALVPILGVLFTGVILLGNMAYEHHEQALEYHAKEGIHPEGVRRREYDLQQGFLRKELDEIQKKMDVMNFKIEENQTTIRKANRGLLDELGEIKEELKKRER